MPRRQRKPLVDLKLDTVWGVGGVLFREEASSKEAPWIAVVIFERIDAANGRQAELLHSRKAPAPIVAAVVQEVFLASVRRVHGNERNNLAFAK